MLHALEMFIHHITATINTFGNIEKLRFEIHYSRKKSLTTIESLSARTHKTIPLYGHTKPSK